MSDWLGFDEYTVPPHSEARPDPGYSPEDGEAAPVVSIITPYHDTGEVFRDTVTSVMRQTLQQWEWIIINDASTEQAALAVLDEYRSADRRIRVVDHPTNRGPSASRNTGFREAGTEYVMQLDSDDLLEPTALEKLYWFMHSYPDYSLAEGYTVGFGAESYVWVNGFHRREGFLESNLADVTAMVRRSVHEEVGGYDESIDNGLEDWDFWLRCADHGYWGDTIHEPLSWYRRRASHGGRWENWDGAGRETAFLERLRARYPRLWEGGFPQVTPPKAIPYEPIPDYLPTDNALVKKRPRILMILPWMTVGGADKFNVDAVEELTDRGWEVTIATTLSGDHSWEREFARFTWDIFALHRFLRPVDYPRFLRYLIGSRQPDLVLVSNSELGYQLLPYLRSHCPEPTYLDFVHMEQPEWKSGGFPNLSNLYRDQVDLTAVVSEHLRNWMIDRGGDPSRIGVCHLGVDVARWEPDDEHGREVRRRLRVPDQVPMILYAGRLTEQKQPTVFAETIRLLEEGGEEFVAVVAGDGGYGPWLEGFISDHGLAHQARLLGAVSSDKMRGLLQAADIFFLPSQWEGIALSIYEAMACGVPVVGADVGGQAELVTPETGILLDRGTPEDEAAAYAEALSALLADPERRQRLGAAARERVTEMFSLKTMGDRFVELIEQAGDLHDSEPRSTVPIESARSAATLAIEYHRISDLLEEMWTSRAETIPAAPRGWRWRVYRVLSVPLGPAYRRAMASDAAWAIRTRDGVRRALHVRSDQIPWADEAATAADLEARVTVGHRVYGGMMAVFGAPYRWAKQRNPAHMLAFRDWARRYFGYRR